MRIEDQYVSPHFTPEYKADLLSELNLVLSDFNLKAHFNRVNSVLYQRVIKKISK